MMPFQWTTQAMQGAIRTGIAVAELQTVMMLRTMALFGLWMPGATPRNPAPAAQPATPARKPARRPRPAT
jgi:hypothetical protein